MTLILINVVLLIIFMIIAFVTVKIYLAQMFFDVSILFKLFIFTIPISLSIVNLILLPLLTEYSVLFGFIPLFIPALYVLFSFKSDYFGEKEYNKFLETTNELYKFTSSNHLSISKENFIIRIRNNRNVIIIINVYSNEEEKKVNELRKELLDLIKSKNPKYNIELLIDKKKGYKNYNNQLSLI